METQQQPPCVRVFGPDRGPDVAAFMRQHYGQTDCSDACPIVKWHLAAEARQEPQYPAS